MTTFTERIKEALSEANGVRQIDLARACGVSTASVSAWFSGETKSIRGHSLTRVASLLKVNPVWLSEGRGGKKIESAKNNTHSIDISADKNDKWPFFRLDLARIKALPTEEVIYLEGRIVSIVEECEARLLKTRNPDKVA